MISGRYRERFPKNIFNETVGLHDSYREIQIKGSNNTGNKGEGH